MTIRKATDALPGGGWTIQWDAENRPVSVTGAAGTSTYGYNGIGDRVKQVTPVGGTDTTTYYFGRFADLVKTSSGTQLVKYYYAGDMLLAKYDGDDGDDTYWFFRDQVDSMRCSAPRHFVLFPALLCLITLCPSTSEISDNSGIPGFSGRR